MIVMGVDQHRGQITAEWLDMATGEVSRARVSPAHREPVQRFLERFDGMELEVALEATTGWPSWVEELRAIGASRHLAEMAARRGTQKRAKSDRADNVGHEGVRGLVIRYRVAPHSCAGNAYSSQRKHDAALAIRPGRSA
jgi:hypothetical protein